MEIINAHFITSTSNCIHSYFSLIIHHDKVKRIFTGQTQFLPRIVRINIGSFLWDCLVTFLYILCQNSELVVPIG